MRGCPLGVFSHFLSDFSGVGLVRKPGKDCIGFSGLHAPSLEFLFHFRTLLRVLESVRISQIPPVPLTDRGAGGPIPCPWSPRSLSWNRTHSPGRCEDQVSTSTGLEPRGHPLTELLPPVCHLLLHDKPPQGNGLRPLSICHESLVSSTRITPIAHGSAI